MTNATFSNGDFRPIKTRKKKHEVQQETLAEVDSEEEEEETEGTASGRLFSCPNEGCVRVYTRYGSMVNHVTYGKCDFREERESVMDTAKVLYSKKLWVSDGRKRPLQSSNIKRSTPERRRRLGTEIDQEKQTFQ